MPSASARAALVSEHLQRQRRQLRRHRECFRCSAAVACALALLCQAEQAQAAPELKTTKVLELAGAPLNENLATRNQAFNVWSVPGANSEDVASDKEMVIALVHQYNNIDKRADDRQFAVAYESDGSGLREVERIQMSCADVDLVVPSRGSHVFEVRLDLSPWSLHPECACPANSNCPAGVHVLKHGEDTEIFSPGHSHFVNLVNEWGEMIADRGIIGRLLEDINAPVMRAGGASSNASSTMATEVDLACPASRDEVLGTEDVTIAQLNAEGIKLSADMEGKWCLVRRGRCSETAKVKLCEASGAVGTIIVDHGNFEANAPDQEISIVYNRAAEETATKPVIFLNKVDGERLWVMVTAGEVNVTVGPSVGGQVPEGYNPGSGIIVHAMGPGAADMPVKKKAYPDIFHTAGWVEVSNSREVMFACFPGENKILLYDISDPMTRIDLLSTISEPCVRETTHDYRVMDYKDHEGNWITMFVDPADSGNKLLYYDTNDLSNPSKLGELRASWESGDEGLGQVRKAGANDKYHLVTWHCSNLYCGDNHGHNLYAINAQEHDYGESAPAVKIPLPTMSQGSFARDIACGVGPTGVCLVTLSWDGMIAFDVGQSPDSVNIWRFIASDLDSPWRDDSVPLGSQYLKMYSGAQKVYASRAFSRHFYVEHADFNQRPLRAGDGIRALQMRELYQVEVKNYDETQELAKTEGIAPAIITPEGAIAAGDAGVNTVVNIHIVTPKPTSEDYGKSEYKQNNSEVASQILIVLVVLMALAICGLCFLVWWTRNKFRKSLKEQDASRREEHMSRYTASDEEANRTEQMNVVVGRPVEENPEGGEAASGQAFQTGPGVTVEAKGVKGKNGGTGSKETV